MNKKQLIIAGFLVLVLVIVCVCIILSGNNGTAKQDIGDASQESPDLDNTNQSNQSGLDADIEELNQIDSGLSDQQPEIIEIE